MGEVVGQLAPTLRPPVAPMLARLAREVPDGDYFYEPKWDGFRCLAFRHGDEVDLRSRHDRPFSRYFPELVEAFVSLPTVGFVLDGEIVAVTDGGFDFAALLGRLHPAASRVARLRREAPASFVAFDLLWADGQDLRAQPFSERRSLLEALLARAGSPLHVTPLTADRTIAQRWLARYGGAGVDGVVAKQRALTYQPGARAMIKIKREQTADCVVAGLRPVMGGEPAVASLLLGLYGQSGELVHIGVVSAFPRSQRRALYDELKPLAVPLGGHPWRSGWLLAGGSLGRLKGSAGRWTPDMTLDWLPLAPERVCEVAYDQVDGQRLRHPARFRRWRPDREPESCLLDQLEAPSEPLHELLRV